MLRKLKVHKHFDTYLIFFGLGLIPILQTKHIFDPYTYIKWIALYCIAVGAAFGIACQKTLSLPRLSWVMYLLLALGMLCYIAEFFWLPVHFISIPNLDRLCLISLILFFNFYFSDPRKNLEQIKYPNLFASFITLVLASSQLLPFLGLEHRLPDFSAAFGNPNMAAQFMGISILIQIFTYKSYEQKKSRILLDITLAFSILYVTLLTSRSVILALLLSLPILIWALGRGSRRRLISMVIIAMFIGLGMKQAFKSFGATKKFEVDNHSSRERYEMWKNTLRMIQDHPFGIGAGAYEFSSIPYSLNSRFHPVETEVYRSPHNEYLRIIAEDGLIYYFCFAAVIILVALGYVKRPEQALAERGFVLAFAIYWAVESMFQFPFENAYPSFVFALLIGYCLSKIANGHSNSRSTLIVRVGIVAVAMSILWVGGSFLTSKILEANPYLIHDSNHYACQVFPTQWRVCLTDAREEISKGNFASAERIIVPILQKSRFNFPAIQTWATLAFRSGHPQSGCRALWIYDLLFAGTSTAHNQLQEYCNPKWTEKFKEEHAFEKYVSCDTAQAICL